MSPRRSAHADRRRTRRWVRWFTPWVLLVGALTSAHAHFMDAQRGTLNVVGQGGFVVMSISTEALTGVDDDGDGRLSADELAAHAQQVQAQIQLGMQLLGADGPRPLEAVMFQLSPDHLNPQAPTNHLVVLGRFALRPGDFGPGLGEAASGLRLRVTLFGRSEATQRQSVTVIHGSHRQQMVLTAGRPEHAVFPSVWRELTHAAWLGAEHLVLGWDHLAFLLLALAAGLAWRALVLTLSAFTLGHALTLSAVAFGWISLPASVVEPAIVFTVVLMAALEWRARRTGQRLAPASRIGLVFGCAMVHGMGLAGALTELGLTGSALAWHLVGFNLGIELAQLAVALLVVALVRLMGARQKPQTDWRPAGGTHCA